MFPDPVSGEGLAVVAATIDRPFAIERLVRSIAARFPRARIYIGDQGGPTPPMKDFYDRFGVTVAHVGYDAGVAAARNAAVDLVTEPCFLLCDDDFIITEETDVSDAARLLDSAPELAVVGGRLLDGEAQGGKLRWRQRYWELFMFLDRRSRLLTTCPIRLHAPEPAEIDGVSHFRCDAVMNWALMRTRAFSEGAGWDERYTCNGEHEDFYLTLKEETDWRVAYLPTMTAKHHHPPNPHYAVRRDRSEGWRRLAEKWGFDRHLELGLGLRLASAPDRLLPEDALTQSALFLGRERADPGKMRRDGVFRVNAAGRLASTTPFNAVGGHIEQSAAMSLRAKIGSTGAFRIKERVWRSKERASPPAEETVAHSAFRRLHLLTRAISSPGAIIDLRIMPVNWNVGRRNCGDEEITATWRVGGRTILHNQKVNFYETVALDREWSTVSLITPPVEGLLTLMLHVKGPDGRGRPAASVEIAAIDERGLTDTGLKDIASEWVNGWSFDMMAASLRPALERREAGLSIRAAAEFRGWNLEIAEIPEVTLADAPDAAWLELSAPPFAFGPGRTRTRLAPGQTRARMIFAQKRDARRYDFVSAANIGAMVLAPRAEQSETIEPKRKSPGRTAA